MQSAELTSQDSELLLKFKALIDANGGTLTHDLSDPEQRAFVKLMHNICGNTEEDFPGLHAMIDAGEPPMAVKATSLDDQPGWETAFDVPQIGFDPASQLATANGYGTVIGGFQTCNISLLVLAPNSSFLAIGSNAGQAPLNTLATTTNESGALTFVPGSSGMMTYSYTSMSGQQVSGTVNTYAAGAVADPVVTEPKRENGNTNPYNANAICIGLGRPDDLTRCDYIFNEPTQDNPIGRLPLVGNVTFTNPIKTLSPGTNFIVDIYVIRTDQGGKSTRLTPTDQTNIYNNFNIAAGNSKMLQWNLPMKANVIPPEPPQAYNPIVFSGIPWATEMVSYMTANITVTLDDGSPNGKPVTVTIQSSDVPDSDPIDGVTYIKPIEFVWHCLGEDTQVSMADGSLRTISEIKAGDTILTAQGDAPTEVSVTHNGNHFLDVYVLETTCGKTLTASAEHLIFTPEGGVPARNLREGAELITLDGKTSLLSIRQESGGGRNLWNLSLGEAPQINGPNAGVGQFFAQGLLVGDARANRTVRYQQINDIDWVKANVPTAYHKDVESTFRRRDRVRMR